MVRGVQAGLLGWVGLWLVAVLLPEQSPPSRSASCYIYVVLLLGVVVAAVLCGAVLHSWRMSSPPSLLGSMPSAIEEDCCDYCGFSHGGVRDGDPVLAPAEAVAREGRPERPGLGANYHELLLSLPNIV